MRIAHKILHEVITKGKKKVATCGYSEDDWCDDDEYNTNESEDTKTPFDKAKYKLDQIAKDKIWERKFSIKESNLIGKNTVGNFGNITDMNKVLYNNIESIITVKQLNIILLWRTSMFILYY